MHLSLVAGVDKERPKRESCPNNAASGITWTLERVRSAQARTRLCRATDSGCQMQRESKLSLEDELAEQVVQPRLAALAAL